jgi:uncharacterized UPF0160 family protein
MLRQTNEFKDAGIVRTRDPAVINEQPIVVDVGGIYDPSKHRYDHHQRGFFETLNDKYKTKLSSAGLVYKHFGKEVLRNVLGIDGKELETVYDRVYEHFVEGIDGIDNGVDQYPTDIRPKYKVSTDLSSRVGYLNPAWNDPNPDIESQFLKAVEMTGREFLDRVNYFGKSWLPARSLVEQALASRLEADPSGQIIILSQFCPWKEHLSNLEEEQNLGDTIKYILFGDSGGSWRVQCMSVGGTFENRLSLPEEWRGRRDEELSAVSGIDGCIFVHMSGFIGGNKTKEGALAMAKKALQIPPRPPPAESDAK